MLVEKNFVNQNNVLKKRKKVAVGDKRRKLKENVLSLKR